MRLFLALELPQAIRHQLFEAANGLLRVQWGLTDAIYQTVYKIRHTREANLHITLKFLGEVRDHLVSEIHDGLMSVDRIGSVELRTQGLEFFPRRGFIHIVATKVAGDVQRVSLLQRSIENVCARLGFDRDDREYRPHVTLVRTNTGIPPHFRAANFLKSPFLTTASFVAPEFVLMESRLRSDAPEYIPLARFPLEIARKLR